MGGGGLIAHVKEAEGWQQRKGWTDMVDIKVMLTFTMYDPFRESSPF